METVNKARALPIFKIGDTDFYVDTALGDFREVSAPWNRISMDEIRETADGATELAFDRNTKNICEDIIDPENIPAHVTIVIVPPLIELDPVGLARKQGLPDDTYMKRQVEEQKQIKHANRHKRDGRRL